MLNNDDFTTAYIFILHGNMSEKEKKNSKIIATQIGHPDAETVNILLTK